MLSLVEIEILRFVHEFGFCEIEQIIKRFELRKSSAYAYMKRLVLKGLVTNARIIKYQPRAYYLTAKCIGLLELDLPVIRGIPLNIYEHQLTVVKVYIQLRKLYTGAVWISERRLFRERKNQDDHIPDGVLVFPDKPCAIEVEKTPKTKSRLEGIMLGYGLQNAYKEVWYVCSASTLPAVSRFAVSMSYIKVFKLADFIA